MTNPDLSGVELDWEDMDIQTDKTVYTLEPNDHGVTRVVSEDETLRFE